MSKDKAKKADKKKHPHLKHLDKIGELLREAEGLAYQVTSEPGLKKKARKAAKARIAEIEAELVTYRDATAERMVKANETDPDAIAMMSPDHVDRDDEDAVRAYNEHPATIASGHFITSNAERDRNDAALKAKVQAKRAAREINGQTEAEAAAIHPEDAPSRTKTALDAIAKSGTTIKGGDASDYRELTVFNVTPTQLKKAKKPKGEVAEAPAFVIETDDTAAVIVDPDAEQPRDRWGRPLIIPPGETKAVGYRRVTTYIDVLEDKTTLIDWKSRTVLAGAVVIEQAAAGEILDIGQESSIVEAVKKVNLDLAEAAKIANKALRKGKITPAEHTKAMDIAEKAHKSILNELTEAAFRAGDGFVKAETGTRIHKLTELHDLGQPFPDDITQSEIDDVAAYAECCRRLGVEIKAVEKFVVLDDLRIGGTLDRLIRYDSPKLGRRVTAIGDVKTGRIDFGGSKMTRQLTAYANGRGYDHRNPEAREQLRANKEVGVIFHLPAGSGVCTAYEIDLAESGKKGLALCRAVWDYRAAFGKTSDIFTEIEASA